MKILYIATNLLRNDSASIRNISLINGLIENNCEVKVITLNFIESLEDKFLKDLINKKVEVEKIEIPKFNKIFLLVNKNKNKDKYKLLFKIKNFIKEFIFFPDVFVEAIKNSDKIYFGKEDYDFIISSSDSKTSHFIAKNLIKLRKISAPWVQIWGDPWFDDIGLSNLSFFTKYRIKINERKILEKASLIFYISELTAEKMKLKLQKLRNKINTLNRSYLKEVVTEKTELENKNIIFSYTGSTNNRNINNLVKSVELYNKYNEKKIELNFYGSNFNLNKNSLINFYPRQSLDRIFEVYKNSQVLVYIDNLYGTTQIPGKIYDYFGTDKLILGLFENGETKTFLEKFERIELIKNDENIELEEVVAKIGKKKILNIYSPKNVAKELLDKISEINNKSV